MRSLLIVFRLYVNEILFIYHTWHYSISYPQFENYVLAIIKTSGFLWDRHSLFGVHWEVGFNITFPIVNRWEKCWWIVEITKWHKFLFNGMFNCKNEQHHSPLRKGSFQSVEEGGQGICFWAFGSVCETCVYQDRWPIPLSAFAILELLQGILYWKLIHTPQMLAQLTRYTCIKSHVMNICGMLELCGIFGVNLSIGKQCGWRGSI